MDHREYQEYLHWAEELLKEKNGEEQEDE